MYPSIFTDELGVDVAAALPVIKSWGLKSCDLRGGVFGRAFETLTPDQLRELRTLLDQHGLTVGCLESSLAKVHLPDAARCRAEAEKLEGIIRAADALDCRLVRAFFYWQPSAALLGALAVRPDEKQKVLDLFAPLAERAQAAGLTLAFENCGVTPDEVLAVLDALGVASWGLAWDVANGWDEPARKKNEAAFVERLVPRCRVVHVKAVGAVPGLVPETIPYDRVLRACHNAGLTGPVSAETHNPDRAVSNTEMSRRVVEVIQRSWPTAAPGSAALFDSRQPTAATTRPYADRPVGFIVVGLGMGASRSKLVTQTPGAKLLGVSDVREERAKKTAEQCGVPYALDFRPWLERKDVEVVYVMTETGRHAEIALQAIAAGKHVLTTKPMDASLAACDAMIRAAEQKGVLLGVDFSRRIEAGPLTLKAAVESGRFGRLLGGDAGLKILRTMDYFRGDGGWRGTKRWDGGGVLSNQSIHHIDEMAFCLGVPAKVRCVTWTQNHAIEAEDMGYATWLYPNGLALTYNATTSYPHSTWYFRLELHGTEGAFAHLAGGPFDKPVSRWFLGGAWTDTPPQTVESPWLSAADNFAAAVRTGADLICPGRDGRRSQAILDAMYRSAADDGAWTPVNAELA